jgi:hypothetical protein
MLGTLPLDEAKEELQKMMGDLKKRVAAAN